LPAAVVATSGVGLLNEVVVMAWFVDSLETPMTVTVDGFVSVVVVVVTAAVHSKYHDKLSSTYLLLDTDHTNLNRNFHSNSFLWLTPQMQHSIKSYRKKYNRLQLSLAEQMAMPKNALQLSPKNLQAM